MIRISNALLIVLAVSSSCGEGTSSHSLRSAEDDQVVSVDADDQEMLAAIENARASLSDFAQRVQSPPASQTAASLKVKLEDGSEVEHVWISNVRIQGAVFSGRIANDVQFVRKHEVGDEVSATADDVTDWMVIDNGRLIGGYSIRLLRSRMSPAERREFDREVGCIIE